MALRRDRSGFGEDRHSAGSEPRAGPIEAAAHERAFGSRVGFAVVAIVLGQPALQALVTRRLGGMSAKIVAKEEAVREPFRLVMWT
jgi:hypothetical protein